MQVILFSTVSPNKNPSLLIKEIGTSLAQKLFPDGVLLRIRLIFMRLRYIIE
jgi:hypothetical protein